ncbi:MAG: right-handed parallel beta-helix repeat-containing protein [Propionibacteriaceae bacterium]|nr:right-handed parallel beta-helix repeat-containing protein [Propionibacteriaceae bacterium]
MRAARRGAWAGVILALVVAGCTSTPEPSPTPSVDPCAAAVDAVTAAVRQYVALYDGTSTASPSAQPSLQPSVQPSVQPSGGSAAPSAPTTSAPDAEAAARALDAAVATAQAALNQGCARADLSARLKASLAQVSATGVVARAVRDRLVSNLTGTTRSEKVVEVGPGDDLVGLVATAASGAQLKLAKGTYRLPATLVLLDGISIVGAGRSATRLVSSAPDAAILVMAPSLVSLGDLTVSRDGGVGSVVVAGSATSTSLKDVRLGGARTGKGKQGGVGLDLTGPADATSPGRTTAMLTDVELVDNSSTGLAVAGGHRASVVDSRFADNGDCGACFLGAAEGSVQTSRFSDNGIAVAAMGTASPVLEDNRISGGKVGIQAGDDARPSISRTRISAAKRAGVIFTGRSGGVLQDTTCVGLPVGIALAKTALPSLKRNPSCSIAQAK